MKEKIEEYLKQINKVKASEHERLKEDLLIHISFYQHERLIHLLVTITFALLTFFSLYFLVIMPSIAIGILFVIFLIMLAFYIKHYYFLENNVQKLYKIYDDLTKTKH